MAPSPEPRGGVPARVAAHDDWMQALAAELGSPRRRSSAARRDVRPSVVRAGRRDGVVRACHAGRSACAARARWVRATEPMVFATRSGHSASPPGVRSSRWTSLRPRPRRPHCPPTPGRGAGLRALRAFPRARARRRSRPWPRLCRTSTPSPRRPRDGARHRAGAAAGVDYVLRGFSPSRHRRGPGHRFGAVRPRAYWSERLGGHDLHVAQLSARGGALRVSVAGDRVRIAGSATTVFSGSIEVPEHRAPSTYHRVAGSSGRSEHAWNRSAGRAPGAGCGETERRTL